MDIEEKVVGVEEKIVGVEEKIVDAIKQHASHLAGNTEEAFKDVLEKLDHSELAQMCEKHGLDIENIESHAKALFQHDGFKNAIGKLLGKKDDDAEADADEEADVAVSPAVDADINEGVSVAEDVINS